VTKLKVAMTTPGVEGHPNCDVKRPASDSTLALRLCVCFENTAWSCSGSREFISSYVI
jgi:hypothetical protein